MKKNTMINAMITLLIGLIIGVVLFFILFGDNGIVNQEKEKYNETHQEEIMEKRSENIVVVNK